MTRQDYMGLLSSLLSKYGPLVLEHGAPLLRDWWKTRVAQSTAHGDREQLASHIEQLRLHAERVESNLDELKENLERLNSRVAAREENLRRWLLVLVAWNIVMTASLLFVAAFARWG